VQGRWPGRGDTRARWLAGPVPRAPWPHGRSAPGTQRAATLVVSAETFVGALNWWPISEVVSDS
jgi:hypothetical protein